MNVDLLANYIITTITLATLVSGVIVMFIGLRR